MTDFNTASDARLGVDIECLDDIGGKWVLVSGARNVALAVARRLKTPRGGLFYDPDYGFDLRQFCNADVTADVMREIRAGVEAEALKDERVREARCTVSWEPTGSRFRVELRCNGAAGPFRMVAAIGSVSVDFLRIEA